MYLSSSTSICVGECKSYCVTYPIVVLFLHVGVLCVLLLTGSCTYCPFFINPRPCIDLLLVSARIVG